MTTEPKAEQAEEGIPTGVQLTSIDPEFRRDPFPAVELLRKEKAIVSSSAWGSVPDVVSWPAGELVTIVSLSPPQAASEKAWGNADAQ